MSQLRSGAQQLVYNVKAFRGVNENADGDTNIKPGEAAVMRNYRITDGGALKVRPGYELAVTGFQPTEPIYVQEWTYTTPVKVCIDADERIEFFRTASLVDGEVVLSDSIGNLSLFDATDRAKIDAEEVCYFKTEFVESYLGIDRGIRPFKFTGYEETESASGVRIWALSGDPIWANNGIVGMWSGTIGGEEMLIFSRNRKIYRQQYNADGTPKAAEEIGEVGAGDHVDAFFFGDKIYFLDGSYYYSYDGETFTDIAEGYIPCVITAANPDGNGTIYEQINKLTTLRKIRYSANGTATSYKLPEKAASVNEVTLNAEPLATTAYHFDGATNSVVFNTAPASGSSNLEVTYRVKGLRIERATATVGGRACQIATDAPIQSIKLIRTDEYGEETTYGMYVGLDYEYGAVIPNGVRLELNFVIQSGDAIFVTYKFDNPRALVNQMRFAETFNGAADTRVFLYGNGTNKAIYSGIMENGKPSAEYFPDLNEMEVGTANTPITAMIRHYNRLLVFKRDGGTYSIYYGQISLADGSITAGFYINSINKVIGCDRDDGAVLVLNRPRTVEKGCIYEWRATSTSGNLTADQRNAQVVSDRVGDTIKSFNMRRAYSYYDTRRHEFYCIYNGVALVQNTENDSWYIYTNFPAVIMAEHDRQLYFGTADGLIYRVSEEITTDNGTPIDAFWESGSIDFGKSYVLKYSPMVWISTIPKDNAQVKAGILTDCGEIAEEVMKLTPQSDMAITIRARLKARKFTFYKLRLATNESGEHATVLSTTVKASYDIPVKRGG